ncbi:MAG: hypothetical protein J7M18_07120 [Candidatus Eremiobacteraeota bacterium]|nr:hypothetical protein [Candidatus Eremiobacteraeota bacterium]
MEQSRRVIISTFSGYMDGEQWVKLPPADVFEPGHVKFIESMAEAFNSNAEDLPRPDTTYIPRELYSLALMMPGEGDRIFFIYPQREESARLADLYKKTLEEIGLEADFQGYNTARDDNSTVSIEMTIKNALEKILQIAFKPYHILNYGILLNGSGGPEELLPYLSMIWAIFSIPLYYLPRGEVYLIQLPSTGGFSFEVDLIQLHENRFKELDREHLMDHDKFFLGLSDEEIHQLSPLLSKYHDKVTLSPLGYLLWEHYWLENPPPLPHSERIPLDKDHLGEVGNELFDDPAFSRFRERLGWNDLVEDFWYVRDCDPGKTSIEVGDPDFLICYSGVVLKVRVTGSHPHHFREIREELARLVEQ